MKTVFYDVDTQNDFMNPDGALYVPGAEKLKSNLAVLTRYAKERGIQIVASVDAHDEKSAEMLANGGPFPYHCMKGADGQKKIPETTLEDALVVPNQPASDLVARVRTARAVIVEKDHYDCSTNPNFAEVIRATGADRGVVYGVATDYCVRAAALALRKLGLETIVVKDAIAAVAPETERTAFAELDSVGVKYTTTAEVLAEER